MFPENLVFDEVVTPKDFDSLSELVETTYRVDHEQTTLESIALKPDGTLHTPEGEWRVARDLWEQCSLAIGMPLAYAYKVSPALFCENFAQRQAETTAPVTISRVGDVATGLIVDRKSRYRPACTADVLRAVRRSEGLTLCRASVSFAGVDVELAQAGNVVEPTVGDIIQLGIAITNSESGGRQLKASAYSYRLACTNGAIMSDEIGTARWPNDLRMTAAASLLAFQKQVSALIDKLESVSPLYTNNVQKLVPDVELFNLWRRVAYVLPRNEADDVLGMAETERRDLQQLIRLRDTRESPAMTERNAYEVHNRITFAAHGRNFRNRRSLQEIGGEFLSRASAWPAIAGAT
ncbi:MAG: hypothetical protein WCB27_25430 [Thermoguttaceae bacterium]|jgi:hypothetical protein